MLDIRRPLAALKSKKIVSRKSRFCMDRYDAWSLGVPSEITCPPAEDVPAIIAVGGGKGGVGKSIISANVSALMSQAGLRVLVIDLDLGCANLHTHYGVSMPARTLADFLLRKTHSFQDIILPSPIQGVAFVAGGREEEWGQILDGRVNYFQSLWEAIFASKKHYNIDVVVFDLGAGTHQHTMNFFSAAHLGIITVLPEPTSIENAYVTLKIALWNLIDNVGERLLQQDVAASVKEALVNESNQGRGNGYVDCLRNLRRTYPDFIRQIVTAIHGRNIGLVVNQARDQSDVDVGRSMEHIVSRYFGLQTKFIGYLNYDEAVWKSLRNRRLLVTDFPHSLIARKLSLTTNQALTLLGLAGG